MKTYILAIITVIISILVDAGGRALAESYSLPMWLDSFGTIFSTYYYGPIAGGIVGVAGHTMAGITYTLSDLVYLPVTVGIIATVTYFKKEHFFDNLFKTMSFSVVLVNTTTLLGLLVNILINEGRTGNVWGDGVIDYLDVHRFPAILCELTGEFYLEFVDKIVTLIVLWILITIARSLKNICRKNKKDELAAVMAGLLLAAFTCAMPAETYAENEFASYVQTIYSYDSGLPCGTANTVAQTPDGIIWVGTYAGLYRYNGHEFEITEQYGNVNNVNCLYADDIGYLWVGTNDRGLSVIADGTVIDSIDVLSGLPNNSVRSITKASDGVYYVGTSDTMITATFDRANGIYVLSEIAEIKYAQSATADKNGNVAVVDNEGNLYLLRDGQILQKKQLGGIKYSGCCFNDNGILYVGTQENYIISYSINNSSLISGNRYICDKLTMVSDFYFDKKGGVVLCGGNGLGYINNNEEYSQINTGSFTSSIRDMIIDYQGNFWIASSRSGLMRLCQSDFSDYYAMYDIEPSVANAVVFYDELMYIGTDTGLDIIDIKKEKNIENELTQQLDGKRIRNLKVDDHQNLWICTAKDGLWKYNKTGMTRYTSNNGLLGMNVRSIIQLSDGTYISAGDNGITFIDDMVTYTMGTDEGLTNPKILCLAEAPDGDILAGSDGGGIYVIRDHMVVRELNYSAGMPSEVILRMVYDDENNLFVVTSNSICVLNSNYDVKELSNFPYANNYDLIEVGDGKLYVPGSAGLYIVDKANLLAGVTPDYILLDAKAGLTKSFTANSWCCIAEDKTVYLCTGEGVFAIDTTDYGSKISDYIINVQKIQLNDEQTTMPENKLIEIEKTITKVVITPEILNYSIEDPYISYFLNGYDIEPTVIRQSQLSDIIYTNLDFGKYTLTISVLDGKNGVTLQSYNCVISVAMEMYDNPWFKGYFFGILIIAIIWITWAIVRINIQKLIRRQREELEVQRNKIELVNQTILAIAKTVDVKDENTSQHSQRVSEYSVLIAKEMGWNEKECENLSKVALLHDIGKIGIKDNILNKNGRLTDEEYAIMKSHVTRGGDILKDFNAIDHVKEGALYHHERWDGKGYAHGLKGEEIPIYARIICVADAFDAMTANRVYRKRLSFDTVLDELKKNRGTQFDPDIVDIMLKIIDAGKIKVSEIYGSQAET